MFLQGLFLLSLKIIQLNLYLVALSKAGIKQVRPYFNRQGRTNLFENSTNLQAFLLTFMPLIRDTNYSFILVDQSIYMFKNFYLIL